MTMFGIIGVAAAYIGAFWVSRKADWREGKRQVVGDTCGVLFAIALLILVEALLQRFGNVSFTAMLQDGSAVPAVVFTAGACIGMAYEYIRYRS